MGTLTIDDPHGFDTVLSTDPKSPAAPYLRKYNLRVWEDLYEIGVIPKHVPIDVLRAARNVGLQASASYMTVAGPTVFNLPVEARRAYVEARNKTTMRETAVRATAAALVTQHGYAAAEAKSLADKVHGLDRNDQALVPAFMAVLLADDLIIRSPLVIDSSIHSVTAKAVVIHRAGEIRALGRYFLLRCDSIHGETSWWDTVARSSYVISNPSRQMRA